MHRSRRFLSFALNMLVSVGLAAPVLAGPTSTPTETPTATPTGTPQGTTHPPGDDDCACVIINISPKAGNMAALKNVEEEGKGSDITKSIGVIFTAEETSPGSCPPGESADGTIRLTIVDDDDDVVIDRFKGTVQCISGVESKVKFGAPFKGPENCKGSAVPSGNVSRGDLHVRAFETQSGSEMLATPKILCRK